MTLTHVGFDEFGFLPAQARDQGRPAPSARRETLSLSDGRALSGIRYGDDPARTVLLHGAGLNAHTWDRTVIALDAPAIAVDLPGHGESDWRGDADYSPALLAADVIAAIEAWADAPVVLVGQSLGGLTALHVAASRPDLVRALTIVDIVPGASSGGASGLAAFYARLEFSDVEDVLDHALSFGLGGGRGAARAGVLLNTRPRPDGGVEWKHHVARLLHDGRFLAPDVDALWRALDAVAAPLTLVRGSHGYLDDADVAAFSARAPEVTVVELDAPHNVQEIAFADLARIIRSAPPRV
ncbi:alpha/beta fold hydrolase [Microbacterium sp. gxy059]|uniref:alpha/beta fold hydrolase n=1 Tax=Microbacterium sp. gxy059 TaxID=2957199 RepID=UPI003D9767A2